MGIESDTTSASEFSMMFQTSGWILFSINRIARMIMWVLIHFLVLVPMMTPCSWALTQLNGDSSKKESWHNTIAWLQGFLYPVGIALFFFFEFSRSAAHVNKGEAGAGSYYIGIFKDRQNTYTGVMSGIQKAFSAGMSKIKGGVAGMSRGSGSGGTQGGGDVASNFL